MAKPVNKTDAEKMVKGWLKTDPKPLNAQLGGQVASVMFTTVKTANPLTTLFI